MYDIIRYINRYKKLDKRIDKLYNEINDETSKNQNSKSYDNKMIKIHKLQAKAMDNVKIITDYLDQNQDVLHMKRRRLFILNILIVIITIIMGINYVGIYKIIAFLISLVVATGNIIGNKALKSIINKSEDDIEKMIANVESRNQQLDELVNKNNKYNFSEVFKIIKEYGIKPDDKDAEKRILGILRERGINSIQKKSLFEDGEEPPKIAPEEQEQVLPTDKPKKKIRRIRRDRDKYV